jgi:hypothetical protein
MWMRRGSVLGVVLALGAGSCATPEARVQTSLTRAAQEQHVSEEDLRRMSAPPSSNCPTEVQSYNHLVCCDRVRGDVWKPSSIAEVKQMVQKASAEKQHLRVIGRLHSANPVLCTDGYAMSLESQSSHLRVQHARHGLIAVADAGMTLRDFDQRLYEEGWSIGFGVIGFRGVTLGGAVATGAHGSSPTENAILSSRVEMLEVVQADGELHTYWRDSTPPDQFAALRASLGLLGVVVRLGFRVERRFELEVKTSFDEEKVLFQRGLSSLLAGCDFGQFVWFPRANRLARICGTRTFDAPQQGAQSRLLMPRASPTYVSLFRGLVELTLRNGAPRCDVEEERWLALKGDGPYVRECCCAEKSAGDVIGPSHLMLSSELTPYHEELPELDFEVAIPMRNAEAALALVNDAADRFHLCLPLIGVFLRFSAADDSTLIGHASQKEPVMFLELVAYASQAHAVKPDDAYYKPYWDVVRTLLTSKYGGRAHWGKNATDLFQTERQLNTDVEDRLRRFRAVRAEMDPDGLFVNDFARDVGLVE